MPALLTAALQRRQMEEGEEARRRGQRTRVDFVSAGTQDQQRPHRRDHGGAPRSSATATGIRQDDVVGRARAEAERRAQKINSDMLGDRGRRGSSERKREKRRRVDAYPRS